MSFLAGAATASLDLETNSFSHGFLEASALMETFPSLITNFMANPLLGIIGVAQTAMSGLISAVTTGFNTVRDAFNTSLENADKINDLATNVGVTADQLSSLGIVAKAAGSGLEEVADAFKFLGKNQAEALAGNKDAMATFAALGIALTDTTGKALPLNTVMLQLSDALAKLPTGGERSRVAMDLLGRSGTNLIATLSQGSAAILQQEARVRAWGATVSAKAAESADKFGDLMGVFGTAWDAITNAIGEPLRESLTPVLEKAVAWLDLHMPAITKVIRETFANIGDKLAEFAGFVGQHWDSIVEVVTSGASFIVTAVDTIVSGLLRAFEMSAQFSARAQDMLGNILDLISKVPLLGRLVDGLGDTFHDAADRSRGLAEAMKNIRETSNGIAENLQQGIDKVGVAASAAGAPTRGSAANRQPLVVNVSTPSFDADEATSQIATKFRPALRKALNDANAQLHISTHRARIEGGM